MYGTVCFLIGLFTGGAVGVTVMCLIQVTRCSDCSKRSSRVNQDDR